MKIIIYHYFKLLIFSIIRKSIPLYEVKREDLKKDIRNIELLELKAFFKANNEQEFRAKQVFEWLWEKSVVDFEEMSNLSLKTRTLLSDHFEINNISVHKKQISGDGTIKSAFKLFDGHIVEGVLIPSDDRMTACISSQVGCSLTCKFCATGYMERKRNLTPAEIYDQVVAIRNQAMEHYQKPLTNIVYMGMGEPLLNYANVLKSVEHITSPTGLNMSPKRITVSTAGVAKMIKKLADDGVKFNLALSLHAANDLKRNEIMPINETNSLPVLKEALSYFHKTIGTKITFEYIIFHGINDGIEDAEELYQFSKNLPCKINIIEYNPIAEASYKNATVDKIDIFKNYLEDRNIIINVRRSRGKDIDAACGQLANKN